MALTARLAAPDAPRPPQGGTPLHSAADRGHVEAVKALAGLGAAVDARDVSEGKGRISGVRDWCGLVRKGYDNVRLRLLRCAMALAGVEVMGGGRLVAACVR